MTRVRKNWTVEEDALLRKLVNSGMYYRELLFDHKHSFYHPDIYRNGVNYI
jgi:hypothetical protein